MRPTEREFYDRLNEIDDDDKGYWLIAYGLMALSGFVVGVVCGYVFGLVFK